MTVHIARHIVTSQGLLSLKLGFALTVLWYAGTKMEGEYDFLFKIVLIGELPSQIYYQKPASWPDLFNCVYIDCRLYVNRDVVT